MRAFQDAVRRRAVEREPVAYILGRRGFRRLELAVDPRALIPRPETELLVEVGLALPARARACSTSAPAAARSRSRSRTSAPTCDVSGSDVSEAALALARANGRRLGLEVRWLHADLLDGRARRVRRGRSPTRPTSPSGERGALAPEIIRHEPPGALFAGADGLDVIRALLGRAAPSAAASRLLALEVGAGQAPRGRPS